MAMSDDVRAPPIAVHTESSHDDTGAPSITIWNLEDDKCILSKNSECCIHFKGFRFHSMETLLCALELEMLGDTKHIRQLAKYARMEYVIVITRSRDDYGKYNLECALARASYISRKHCV